MTAKAKRPAPKKAPVGDVKKPKGKAKKKGKEEKGKEEKVDSDPVSDLGSAQFPSDVIPHTGKEKFANLRSAVLEHRGAIDSARWQLAEALFRVHDETVYAHWGYPSWETYVGTEVGMTVRTAHYLVSMYGYFVIDLIKDVSGLNAKDPVRIEATKKRDEIVEQIKELGWTKGKSLVGVLDRENADEWIAKAREMSSTELEGAAKKFLQESQGMDGEVEIKRGVSFRMTEEQLIPVENALEMAGGMLESTNRGHIISMICQDFVATNMGQTSEGRKRMGVYFDKLGASFGTWLIAVDKETGEVVHNKKLFESESKK